MDATKISAMESGEVVFVGFEVTEKGVISARFKPHNPKKYCEAGETSFVLTRYGCETRLRNRKAHGRPFEETERAMDRWPVEIGSSIDFVSPFANLN